MFEAAPKAWPFWKKTCFLHINKKYSSNQQKTSIFLIVAILSPRVLKECLVVEHMGIFCNGPFCYRPKNEPIILNHFWCFFSVRVSAKLDLALTPLPNVVLLFNFVHVVKVSCTGSEILCFQPIVMLHLYYVYCI